MALFGLTNTVGFAFWYVMVALVYMKVRDKEDLTNEDLVTILLITYILRRMR